ncbi:MAG: helix-turn-helix transcriptional regulator [Sphingomonadales bacterium]|jgi:transcriptional regulator with XRE-family HTH domain|nr:helix-turn-helix transcriptional regulator [Sphingomonadales bacterium]
MDIRKLLGANVRRYRLSANLSQEAVAVRMGADRAFVSQIERGGQNVTLLTIHHLAEALGVRPVDLLDEDLKAEEYAIGPRPVEPDGA